MESSSICGDWWTLPAAVSGGNPAFDPDTLSTAVCQDFLERNRMFTGLISCSADNMVPWLEKENMHWVKVILVSYFARKNNYLFWYGCGLSIGNSIKLFLRCSFPGGLPKMKLHIQWSCVLCPAVKAYGHLTSCKSFGEMIAFEHGQRTMSDWVWRSYCVFMPQHHSWLFACHFSISLKDISNSSLLCTARNYRKPHLSCKDSATHIRVYILWELMAGSHISHTLQRMGHACFSATHAFHPHY